MKSNRAVLEAELENYEERLKSVSSYAAELKATIARLGTDPTQVEEDLMEAEHNIKFYQGEIALIKKALGATPSPKPSPGPVLSELQKPGIGSVIASSITFIVGALIGSKLSSRKNK
jgi:septal ring factor EnvC (AmiA/AmiB activator)